MFADTLLMINAAIFTKYVRAGQPKNPIILSNLPFSNWRNTVRYLMIVGIVVKR